MTGLRPGVAGGRSPRGGEGSSTLSLMDAWIGLGGVVLGALIAGGATFLTGKLADDRARQAERKEHVARVGAEFLREADRVEQYLLDYVHEHAAVPGDNEEWGETAELARIAWELRLFAPRPVNDAAAELVDVLEAWESGVDGRGRDVLEIHKRFVSVLRVYLHGEDD